MKYLPYVFILMIGVNCLAEDKPSWKKSAAIGFNFTKGNSDTSIFNIDLGAGIKGGKNEFQADASFSYGETGDLATEENSEIKAQYNRLITDRMYLYYDAEIKSDRIAYIDYRILTGPGVGRYLIRSDKHNLSLELGVFYLKEEYRSGTNCLVCVGDTSMSPDTGDDAVVWRCKQAYKVKLSETARLWETVEYLPEIDDNDVYLFNSEIGIEAAIILGMSLRFVVQDKYDSKPAPGVEKNDVIIKSSLVFSL